MMEKKAEPEEKGEQRTERRSMRERKEGSAMLEEVQFDQNIDM